MKRPNIVMLMTDQQGCHMLGCYGNSAVKTPNIDKLAKRGIMHRQNFVQAPICMPSRASIFTGRYPSVCNVLINGVPMKESETTLPYALSMGGYHTAAFGKLHFKSECFSMDPSEGTKCEHEGMRPYYGFKEYKISNGNFYGPYSRWLEREHPEYFDVAMGYKYELLGGTADCWMKKMPYEVSQTYWVGEESVNFIKRGHKQPFFLFSSFLDPHHPFDPTEEYYKKYDNVKPPPRNVGPNDKEAFNYSEEDWDIYRKAAYAQITQVDDAVGRIVAALEEKGILDDTIIIFTTDHGEMLGEHNLLYKQPQHYDELINTPLIWHCPERWKNPKVIDCLTQSLDIMPTILEIAGLPVPDEVQGQSMLPLLNGETDKGRERVLVENDYVNTLVTPEWKLSVWIDRYEGMLFDRLNDKKENNNLFYNEKFKDVKAALMLELVRAMMNAREHSYRQEGYW